MSAPTLKQLIEKATPGPWSVLHRCIESPSGNLALLNLARPDDVTSANAQLIARCNPAVMAEVLGGLEEAASWIQELADDGDGANWVVRKNTELAEKLKAALALLNGVSQP